MSENQELQDLLEKTSRTFALSIPLLPEPTRSEVSIAYLLFRIIDTLEDATYWPPRQRVEALEQMRQLLILPNPSLVSSVSARWLATPPVKHAGYLELLLGMPHVFDWYQALNATARQHIARYADKSAHGMIRFIGRTDTSGVLRLESVGDLREYCFVVAGLVGEMLTELFVLGRPELAAVAPELRRRAAPFGEGLQLVNILKDVSADAAQGRVYLPHTMPLAEVFALARRDLQAAAEYNEMLRAAASHRGLWAFNALNARLATASLDMLQAQGLGSKLTRGEVSRLQVQIQRAAELDVPLVETNLP
jgi:farnesyl-diphosphate farnesyltransferase